MKKASLSASIMLLIISRYVFASDPNELKDNAIDASQHTFFVSPTIGF